MKKIPQTENRKPKTFLVLAFLLLPLMVGSCGKKLMPYSPDRVLPAAVRDFRLTQEGNSLVLSWLLPRENLLGQPLTQVQGCRVYRAAVRGLEPVALFPQDFVPYADIDLAYPLAGVVQGEALMFQDRELTPGSRYFYQVAAYDQSGFAGVRSPALSHAWGWLPRAPQALQAVPGDRTVQLSWPAVTKLENGSPIPDMAGYLVFRRSGAGSWIQVSPQPVTADHFQDVAVLNDVEYTYKVDAVRRLGGDLLASLDSPTKTVLPQKTTPPPPLLNLLAVATSKGVELRWEPSPAPDLAGYRVYRQAAGEARATLLTTELLTRPYFVDADVRRGQTYQYYVTAVDNTPRANESLPSERVEISY